jgi:predicted alpha/beta-fold hydrolase
MTPAAPPYAEALMLDTGSTLRFPDFVPRRPWVTGDLQTLREFFTARPTDLSAHRAERLLLPLGDGDALSGALHRAAEPGKPLVVLLHGLTGCEDSHYIQRSADYLLRAGWPVLRLNLRGAGPSRAHCRGHYSAGCSEDLRRALAALPADATEDGLVLVGYSLGGNVLLKFLGEGGLPGVRAGVAISSPVDLEAAARRILRWRNVVYHRHILARMKVEALARGAEVSARERMAIEGARTLVDFDDGFTGPRNGYAGAADYYARCSAKNFFDAIEVPTLVIHALDDPWIPGDMYLSYDWRRNPRLVPLLPRAGGHVGFARREKGAPWHDVCLALFLAGL